MLLNRDFLLNGPLQQFLVDLGRAELDAVKNAVCSIATMSEEF